MPGQPAQYVGGDGWSRYLGPIYTPEGTHTLYFYAVDVAGNRGEIGSFDVDVQLPPPPGSVAPVLDPIGDKSVAEGAELAFIVHATDANADPLTYGAVGIPDGAALDPATGAFVWTPSFAQAGEYVVTFTATDGELSDSDAVTLTVTDTNRPPVANDATVTTTAGKPVTVTLSATDPDGDPLSWLPVPVVAPTLRNALGHGSQPHLHAQGGLRGHRCVRVPGL